MPQDDAIARLARQISATEKAERLLVDSEHVARLRREGACDLHGICAEFVSSVNRKLSGAMLDLSPLEYSGEVFREPGVNLFQIGSQGRQVQIAFQAPAGLSSTEKFPIPYVLEGELRTFNQKMLEHFDVRSRLIFFCVENDRALWRHYDWRTRATGPLSGEVLAGLLQPLF